MNFLPFPSIESFHNVVKAVSTYPHLASGVITYRGKIKLHGTNAAIRIVNGEVAAQSRSQIITLENDNAGFARWAESKTEYFKSLELGTEQITIFGEWCGPGIMKGTAISNIPKKVFAIFAIMVGSAPEDAIMITDPLNIDMLLTDEKPDDIHILPWEGDEFTVDFSDREKLQQIADILNKSVEKVEPCDPWVKATFGVEGICEGIVYVPVDAYSTLDVPLIKNFDGCSTTRKRYSDLSFKAKGEKHKVVKTKESVQIDPEVATSIKEFVTMFATEARFEQGMSTLGQTFDLKQIGPFLKWVGQDVFKESADELEASGLEWSDVEKSVIGEARKWYLAKNKAI